MEADAAEGVPRDSAASNVRRAGAVWRPARGKWGRVGTPGQDRFNAGGPPGPAIGRSPLPGGSPIRMAAPEAIHLAASGLTRLAALIRISYTAP
jgi:hypothetical protein